MVDNLEESQKLHLVVDYILFSFEGPNFCFYLGMYVLFFLYYVPTVAYTDKPLNVSKTLYHPFCKIK